MHACSPSRFRVFFILASLLGAASPAVTNAAGLFARPASGAIDSVLLQWRAQLKGCGQPAAAELYRLRDVDALLHVAMFEAVNSIERRYTPFVALVEVAPGCARCTDSAVPTVRCRCVGRAQCIAGGSARRQGARGGCGGGPQSGECRAEGAGILGCERRRSLLAGAGPRPVCLPSGRAGAFVVHDDAVGDEKA